MSNVVKSIKNECSRMLREQKLFKSHYLHDLGLLRTDDVKIFCFGVGRRPQECLNSLSIL